MDRSGDPSTPKTPLVLMKPAKKIGEMTDAERRALADELFEKMAKAVKRAEPS